MFRSCVCCVRFLGYGLCDWAGHQLKGILPSVYVRLIVCDLETLTTRHPSPELFWGRHKKKYLKRIIYNLISKRSPMSQTDGVRLTHSSRSLLRTLCKIVPLSRRCLPQKALRSTDSIQSRCILFEKFIINLTMYFYQSSSYTFKARFIPE